MWSQTKNPSQPRSSAAEANSASTRGSASSPNGAMSMARFTWQSLMESGGIPLRQWAAVGAPLVLAGRNLGPAVGGVLPRLLAPEHGPVQQAVRPEAGLVAAVGRPVGLVDAVVIVAHVAAEPAEVAVGQQASARVARRVPRCRVAHEVRVRPALFIAALAEVREGHVARVQVRQWTLYLGCEVGAADALPRPRFTVVPHMEVADEHPASLEDVQERNLAFRADHGDGRGNLDHRQAAALGGERVARAGVCLLLDQ